MEGVGSGGGEGDGSAPLHPKNNAQISSALLRFFLVLHKIILTVLLKDKYSLLYRTHPQSLLVL